MTTATHIPPRWLRWALVSLVVLLGSLAYGVTTATATLSLGPHEATYSVRTDGQVTVDLGPLGTLKIDSPLPAGLGVDVVVKEIPDDLTAIGQAQTLEALSGDLNSYLQFFAGPEQTFRAVAEALAVDALRRAAVAFVVVALVVAGLAALLGGPRRREVGTWLAEHTWGLAAGTAVVALVAAGLTSEDRRAQEEPASPVFANTPLEGARITGRLAGVIDTYGAQLIGVYEENVDFYDQANGNLVRAFEARGAQDSLLVPAAARDGSSPGAEDPAATEGDTGAGEEPDVGTASGERPSVGASASPTASPSAREGELVTLLVVSDLHCNTGMTPLIATAIRHSGADVVLNAGDTTMNGTSVESFCVDSFASAVPKGVTMVVADGNHDSTETSAQERKKGQEVLDGDVIEVAGIRILGDRDALETRVGQGSSEARDETPTEQAERLAETACGDGRVDLLLVHSPRAGNEALESGCVPVQISGHTHLRSGPEAQGDGVRYVSGSTAGAAPSQPTVGPLHGTAEMTVLRFDPVAHRFVDWQLVQVRPDTTAVVGPRLAFPAADPGADLVPLDDTHPGEESSDPADPEGAVDPAGAVDPVDPADPAAVAGAASSSVQPPAPGGAAVSGRAGAWGP